MSLLPRSPELTADAGPRVVGVDSEDADALMAALSSETARCVLSELHDEPAPPAELAGRVDTTLQNAQYHLERLEDAGAIEVVGTAYSEKGREMDVYAPADEPLVIFAGREESASGLRAALSRLLGGFAALAFGALVVQELFGRKSVAEFLPLGAPGGAPAAGGDDRAPAAGGDGGDGGDSGDGGGAGAGGEGDTATPTAESTGEADGAVADTTQGATDTTTPAGTATPTDAPGDAGGVSGSPTPTPEATGTPTPTAEAADAAGAATSTPTPGATETAANATATATDAVRLTAEAGGLPPGLLFFLGGALVLTVGVAVTYMRR